LEYHLSDMKNALASSPSTKLYTMLYATGYGTGKVSSADYIRDAGLKAMQHSDGVIMYHMQTEHLNDQSLTCPDDDHESGKCFREPVKEVLDKKAHTKQLFMSY
jgi:hypothetical protein